MCHRRHMPDRNQRHAHQADPECRACCWPGDCDQHPLTLVEAVHAACDIDEAQRRQQPNVEPPDVKQARSYADDDAAHGNTQQPSRQRVAEFVGEQ